MKYNHEIIKILSAIKEAYLSGKSSANTSDYHWTYPAKAGTGQYAHQGEQQGTMPDRTGRSLSCGAWGTGRKAQFGK